MTQAQMTDIGAIDTAAACDAGAEVELLHPTTRQPLGVFWSVLGKDSAVVQDHLRARYDTDVRKAAQARKRGKEPEVLTHDQIEERGVELLLAASTGWRTGDKPVMMFNGEELPFTKANARRVLTERGWIKNQIDEAAADLENFMKA